MRPGRSVLGRPRSRARGSLLASATTITRGFWPPDVGLRSKRAVWLMAPFERAEPGSRRTVTADPLVALRRGVGVMPTEVPAACTTRDRRSRGQQGASLIADHLQPGQRRHVSPRLAASPGATGTARASPRTSASRFGLDLRDLDNRSAGAGSPAPAAGRGPHFGASKPWRGLQAINDVRSFTRPGAPGAIACESSSSALGIRIRLSAASSRSCANSAEAPVFRGRRSVLRCFSLSVHHRLAGSRRPSRQTSFGPASARGRFVTAQHALHAERAFGLGLLISIRSLPYDVRSRVQARSRSLAGLRNSMHPTWAGLISTPVQRVVPDRG